MLPDRHDVDQLRGVGIEIDHVRRFLGRLSAGVHGHPHVGLGQGGRVVRAVAGHGHQLALGLLPLDGGDFVFGRGFRDEVIHPGFSGNHFGGDSVVAREHDGADPHPSELVKPLADAGFDHVFQIDHAVDLVVFANRQGCAPQPRHLLEGRIQVGGNRATARSGESLNRVHRALAIFRAIGQIRAAHPGAGGKVQTRGRFGGGIGAIAQFFRQPDDRLVLGGLVKPTGGPGHAGHGVDRVAAHGDELFCQAVAQGNRAGFVQQQGVDVAASFHGPAGGGDHVELGHPIHPGNPDRAQQPPDRGGDQGHQQGNQNRNAGGTLHIGRYGRQGGDRQQKHLGQHRQQHREGNFVGGFAALGPFHQGNHPIDEPLPRIGGDANRQLVGHNPRAARDAAGRVRSRLLQHRSRLAGNRRLIHRSHPGQHFPIGGDHIARGHPHPIAPLQPRCRYGLFAAIGQQPPGDCVCLGGA